MSELLIRERAANLLRSAALLAAMTAVLALVGWTLAGTSGALVALAVAALVAWLAPSIGADRLLRANGARPLHPSEAPWLHRAVGELSARAGLSAPPPLYLVPIPGPQALATGEGDRQAIAVSPDLLRALPPREVIAVVAHEISHLRHRDMRLLRIAETVRRTTRTMSSFGLLLLVLNLPLLLLAGTHVPWLGVLLLMAAPWAVGLLSLALSRAREHDADAGAVALTGDPLGLASALSRIEALARGPWWTRVLALEVPSSLRSHPPTEARVARLRAMAAGARPPAAPPPAGSRPRRRGAKRAVTPIWIRRDEVPPARAPRRFVVG